MANWPIDARGICVVLMAIGGVLLGLRLNPRASRTAWLVGTSLNVNLKRSFLMSIIPRENHRDGGRQYEVV